MKHILTDTNNLWLWSIDFGLPTDLVEVQKRPVIWS
jgi:hypothetical protein